MIRGFQITQKIHDTGQSSIFRALRTADDCPVVLKMLNSEYPTPRRLARHRQEYEIISSLQVAGVIKAYSLEKLKNTTMIVLEDYGGSSLNLLFESQRPTIEQLLELAIQATAAIGQVHEQGVIHKDINPSNIVSNPRTNQLKLIDFGIATRLSNESPSISDPNNIEGTWPYISPEQTGRTSRRLDYRTDFYSLGVTLYELLTGQLPFDKSSALELVHCHIAAQPRPPVEVREDTPPVLSRIIMKLLAKTAEERYQSARGLEADLERCLEQIRSGQGATVFPLAREDVSDRFAIPQKLYGRARETNTLLDAFERVSQGRRESVLVTGYSGIGKSSLVRELYKPITKKNAFFVSGKFDLFQRATPYSALSATLSGLVKQLLTRSKPELLHWQNAFHAALGPNGRILIDLIPELELIIGPQPQVEELGPIEVQNRLHLAFRSFIRVFCKPAHPLVLFLDDLQWVDTATLRLLEPLLVDEELSHFLLIGVYRDNEVDSSHPLAMTLQGLGEKGVAISEIRLHPLRLEDIVQMLVDTLDYPPEQVRSLAELVLHRTGGNPYFINVFLEALHEDGLLGFDASLPGWRWDMAEIEATPVTENVAELLSPKLRRLPEEIQRLLRLAACLGHRFKLDTLALVADRSLAETYEALMTAIEEGYIYPVSEPELMAAEGQEAQLYLRQHRFAHDRVQQATYALIPADQRAAVHLDIGRILLSRLPAAEREGHLFELVDHLNLGRSLIDTSSGDDSLTPVKLARLNLEVGRQAKEAAAYGAAARYLAIGIELADDVWDEHHELALALHVDGAVAEYCHGDFERSQALIDTALRHATSVMVKARLYQTLILQYTNQGRHEDAFQVARDALSLLGHALPRVEALADALVQELADVRQILGDRPLELLVDAPEASDASCRAAIEILGGLAPAAYQSDRDMFDFITTRMVRLTLEYGHTVAGVYGYALHGVSLGSRFADYQRGYRFGALALRLADRFHSAAAKAKAGQVMFGFLYHWVEPLHGFLPISTESFEASLQSGELQDACFNLMERLVGYYHQGMSLERILDESSSFLQFARNNNNTVVTNTIEAIRIAAAHLSDHGGYGDIIDMEDDAPYLARCHEEASLLAIGCYHLFKCQVLYLYGEYDRALQAAIAAEELRGYMAPLFSGAALTFYHSLCLTALYPHASPEQQQESWQRLEALQAQMKIWMESCPRNFRHMYLLVAAEMAHVTGDALGAVDLYADAIEAAEESEFRPDLALAHELAARFWRARRKTGYADFHTRDAHYNYALWGAERKVAMMEGEHGQLLMRHRQDKSRTAVPTTTDRRSSSGTSTAEQLDLGSAIKASQALSSEISLDRLLARVIEIAIENAGAQHGYLILERKNRLAIEARGTLGEHDVEVLKSLPLEGGDSGYPLVSTAIVHYVLRSREVVVLHDAAQEGPFVTDPYVVATGPRSIICLPLLNQGKASGVIYLENNLSSRAFTPERVELLSLLSSQMAISLENSYLYSNLHWASQDLEQLIYSVVHDLKEPLRAIHSFSDLFVRRYDAMLDTQGRDYLDRVRNAARHLRDLLDAIRTVSEVRHIDGLRQEVSGEGLVLAAERRMGAAIEQTRATIRTAADLPPRLAVDERWASEAIRQILQNALQYARDGVAPEIDIEPYDGSEGVGMVIKDRGPGIPVEYAEKAFTLFWRGVGRHIPGTGAGLAIVRQIAAKHGGNAWLGPRAGGGTEVFITFGR